jgi:hypothetical protein
MVVLVFRGCFGSERVLSKVNEYNIGHLLLWDVNGGYGFCLLVVKFLHGTNFKPFTKRTIMAGLVEIGLVFFKEVLYGDFMFYITHTRAHAYTHAHTSYKSFSVLLCHHWIQFCGRTDRLMDGQADGRRVNLTSCLVKPVGD